MNFTAEELERVIGVLILVCITLLIACCGLFGALVTALIGKFG